MHRFQKLDEEVTEQNPTVIKTEPEVGLDITAGSQEP